MKKPLINVKGKFNTSFGTVLLVEGNENIHVGETVETNEGTLRIKKVMMPTRPDAVRLVGIVVQET